MDDKESLVEVDTQLGTFGLLPDELIIKILLYVPRRDLLTDVVLVNRKWNLYATSDHLWRLLFLDSWGEKAVKVDEIHQRKGQEEQLFTSRWLRNYKSYFIIQRVRIQFS